MWVSSVSPSLTLQSCWKKKYSKFWSFYFSGFSVVSRRPRLQYYKCTCIIICWFWNYHGLAVIMHVLHVQTKLKLPITARTDICSKKKKKKSFLKNIYVSSNIVSFGNKLEHALRCINNIHSVISAFPHMLKNAFKWERERGTSTFPLAD